MPVSPYPSPFAEQVPPARSSHIRAITSYSADLLETHLQHYLNAGWRIISIYFAQGVHIAWIERHEHD